MVSPNLGWVPGGGGRASGYRRVTIPATRGATAASAMIQRVSIAFVAAAVWVVCSCGQAPGPAFWKAGEEYDLQLVVTRRDPRLPGYMPPSTDSLDGRLTVDSARGDSWTGRYTARLDWLGVSINDYGHYDYKVDGRVWGDSFEVVIASNVIDAALPIWGSVRSGVASGSWRRSIGATMSGTFDIRPIGATRGLTSRGPQGTSAEWNTPQHVVFGTEDSIMSFTASVAALYHCMPMAVPGELGNRVLNGCMEQQTGAAPGDFVFRDTTGVHWIIATGVMLGGTRARFDSVARVLTAHFGSPRWCPGRTGRLGNANYPPSLQWRPPGLTIQLRLGAPYAGAASVVEAQTVRYSLMCGDWIYGLGPG